MLCEPGMGEKAKGAVVAAKISIISIVNKVFRGVDFKIGNSMTATITFWWERGHLLRAGGICGGGGGGILMGWGLCGGGRYEG